MGLREKAALFAMIDIRIDSEKKSMNKAKRR